MLRRDLTGLTFGKLTVLEASHKDKKGNYYYKCLCSCGKEKTIRGTHLTALKAKTTSCGCYMKELNSQIKKTHGKYGTPVYNSWQAIKQRCLNSNDKDYSQWGGKGITLQESWLDFNNFYSHVGDSPGPGYSIDRINNEGNYTEGNVRWATPTEQTRNSSCTKLDIYKVREVRSKSQAGASQSTLCKEYSLSQAQISRIINYVNWKEEAGPLNEERPKDGA